MALLDTFQALVVQEGEAMSSNNEIVKFMGRIAKDLDVIGNAPSGGFAKVAIKARLLDSFTWKETKTKKM